MLDKLTHLKIVKGRKKKVLCPLCQKQAEVPHSPFCSRRCAQLDLGKWLTGDYAIPAYEAMDDSDIETLFAAHEAKQAAEVDKDF